MASGKITGLEEIFENRLAIKEPEIVKTLVPDMKSNVVSVSIVQKQTDAGEMTRFNALVAVGNENGWFGIGKGKAPQVRNAIEKSTNTAFLNVIPIRLGCGSWECRCSEQHSIPYRTVGKGGSVRVEIIPGPRGLGIVAGQNVKGLLALAGIKDAWTKTFGSTTTTSSVVCAVYDAMKKVHLLNVVK